MSSLGNPHYSMSFDNTVREDPKNKYCMYKLMHYYVNIYLLKDYTGKLFVQKTSAKTILNCIDMVYPIKKILTSLL